uniref:B30.2/SPRY domain-containing protein n=1 Tax=Paramormyrops kingsleyae TaxID=1676925 RepID=A0A3B3SA21_9TELE
KKAEFALFCTKQQYYEHGESAGKLLTFRDKQLSVQNIIPSLLHDSCQLTLDPNTAHRHLSLSEGNRKVTRGAEWQPYPDHPERFDCWPQVLCRESLTGRCYWEAEWDGKKALIGVTFKGIGRKQGRDCMLGANDKSWSLCCYPDSYSVWHNNKKTVIPIRPSGPRRVGVYLDWGAGALSFYRVSSDGLTLLHRVTSSFTEPLCPGFGVYDGHSFFEMNIVYERARLNVCR